MMRESQLKFVGLCFVLLLAGSEAARINRKATEATTSARLSYAADAPESEAEATLQREERDECMWRLRKLGCHGNCAFRPLPLDRRLSDSCRLTPEYMLRSEESALKYTKLESQLLAEKADKFSATCSGTVRVTEVFGRRTMRCLRRGAHMMQATRFMLQVQGMVAEGNASVKVVKTMEYSVNSAKESLAKTLGDDAVHYTLLSQKVTANAADILKAPQQQMKLIVGSVAGLVNKNETVKEQARDAIAAMPVRADSTPTHKDIEEMKKLVGEHKDQDFKAGDEVKGWRMLDKVVPAASRRSAAKTTALLQQDDDTNIVAMQDNNTKVPTIALSKILLILLVFALVIIVIEELFKYMGIWATFGFFAPAVRVIVVCVALAFVAQALVGNVDIDIY